MTKDVTDRDVRFEPDFSAAVLDDGSVVKFTRLERRALAYFNESAGRTLTRGQILDAVSEPGSERSDRSVDFLINRIRGKLGDLAQAPQFIGTQYGEGYVWLRSRHRARADLSEAFAVVGPFLGVESLGELTGCADEIARLLQADLGKSLQPAQLVAVAPNLTKAERDSGPALSLQLGFFRDQTGAEWIVTTRRGKGDHIIDLQRFSLVDGPEQLAALSAQSRLVARRAVANYWRDVTSSAAAARPVPVAINEATMPVGKGWSWTEADRRLRLMRAEHPDDPAVKMMWATHLHAKYVQHGIEIFRTGAATCAEDESEIERLVFEALDFVQDRPEFAVMAGKLLYFVDQRHRDLALDLATRAHRANTSLTSTLAILGQLHGFVGNMELAENYLTQAVDLCEKNSEEQIYAFYMLIQAYMAAGAHARQAAALKRMYRVRPATALFFEPFFTDPIKPSLRARGITLMLKRTQATAMLRCATYVSARLYEDPRHRENALLTPATLFVKRFGPSVVPEEAALHLPGLASPGRR